jgi:hypothetical protein
MTTVIDPNILEALEAAPIPYDFFREVHKGLRHALYELTTAVGAADCADATARAIVAERVQDTLALLHSHHGHEDIFIRPLLERHAPRLNAMVDAGHHETEADLVEIEFRTDALVGATDRDAIVAGLDLYRYLALFTARYVAHMALEEGEVMRALRDAMSVAELFEVDMALRASVPPPMMCAFIAVMAPAMNPEERTNMLGGMQAGAPPEIFELFRAAAEAALDPASYRAVATQLGLA